MKNINDILAHYEEQPPAECWDKLSSHLDKIMPTGESAATSTSAAVKGATATLSKAVTASIIGAVAVAAITIVAVTAAHKSSAEKPTADNQTNVVADSSIVENIEDTPSIYLTETKEASSASKKTENEVAPSSNTSAKSAENPTPESNIPFVSQTAQMNVPSASVQPKAAPTITKTIAPIQSASVTKAPLPKNSTIAQQHQNDPVVQSHSEEEDFSWNTPVKLEIPNVFTPNGDGYNEVFMIKGLENCSKRQLVVRNRSGKIVYRSNNYENTWNGDNCPDGTYTYQLFYNNNGIDQSMSGTVAIIRK